MPKKGRLPLDPLKNIGETGFIGYVEEETHKADEPGVIWVDIEFIQDNPYQHAEDIHSEDFQGLVESIRSDGFLGALNVSPSPKEVGQYFLNGGGHQRRNAARMAGLTKLPVFVTETPIDPVILAFRVARENTTRVNTSMINLGNLYQQMIDEFGLTQEDIAQRIQKDRNHVKFALTAARSPKDIQGMLRQRPDSLRAMTYFRRLDQEEDRKPIMDRFLVGELSTERVRQEVEALLERQRQTQEVPVEVVRQEPSRDEVVATTGAEVQTPPLDSAKPVSPEAPLVVSIREASPAEMQPNYQGKPTSVMPRQQTSRPQSQQLQMVLEILQSLHRQAPLLEMEYRLLEQISGVAQQLQQQEKAVSQET